MKHYNISMRSDPLIQVWTPEKLPEHYRRIIGNDAGFEWIAYVPAALVSINPNELFPSPGPTELTRRALGDGGALYLAKAATQKLPTRESDWIRTGCGEVALSGDDVHLWRANSEVNPHTMRRLVSILSPFELDFAARFRETSEHQGCIVSQALLRHILAGYLEMPPHEIPLAGPGSKHGRVKPTASSRPFFFDWSFADNIGLFAVSLKPLALDMRGTDRPIPEHLDRVLSKHEIESWQLLPQTLQKEAFFAAWTTKSAWRKLKQSRARISPPIVQEGALPKRAPVPLRFTFHVDESTMKPAREMGQHNSVWQLQPAPGFSAALVVESSSAILRQWEVGRLYPGYVKDAFIHQHPPKSLKKPVSG